MGVCVCVCALVGDNKWDDNLALMKFWLTHGPFVILEHLFLLLLQFMLLLKAGSQWQKYFRARLALFINGLMGGLFVSFIVCHLKKNLWHYYQHVNLLFSVDVNSWGLNRELNGWCVNTESILCGLDLFNKLYMNSQHFVIMLHITHTHV